MYRLMLFFIMAVSFRGAWSQFGSVSFSMGLPQNEFRQNTDALGYGLDLTGGISFQEGVPLFFGLDINYMIYGYSRKNEELTAEIRANEVIIDELVIPLRLVNTSSIFGTHALIRAQAPFDNVQPYIEGLIGFRYISTSSKILDRSDNRQYTSRESNVLVRETILDDWLFSYGYGGGMMVNLGSNIFLDFRADFFEGKRAKYYDGDDTKAWSVEFTGSVEDYDEETVSGDDLEFDAEPKESTTDLLTLKLGVVFMF